ncbi:MAG: histidine kinase [Tannerellaceae bacterium]|jgi:signal transduction histidine kinase|nr:histidine kinase [Tannerellaceae bacterium]
MDRAEYAESPEYLQQSLALSRETGSKAMEYDSTHIKNRLALYDNLTERRLYAVLGMAILTASLPGTGLLFYRHRSATQKRKPAEQQIRQLKQEKELIAARSALDAEKNEREIIARDLHDGLGAMLSVTLCRRRSSTKDSSLRRTIFAVPSPKQNFILRKLVAGSTLKKNGYFIAVPANQ